MTVERSFPGIGYALKVEKLRRGASSASFAKGSLSYLTQWRAPKGVKAAGRWINMPDLALGNLSDMKLKDSPAKPAELKQASDKVTRMLKEGDLAGAQGTVARVLDRLKGYSPPGDRREMVGALNELDTFMQVSDISQLQPKGDTELIDIGELEGASFDDPETPGGADSRETSAPSKESTPVTKQTARAHMNALEAEPVDLIAESNQIEGSAVQNPDGTISIESGRNSPIQGDSRKSAPLKYIYRAISADEIEGIKKNGFMQSDGRMNLADDEGTVASHRNPQFYLPSATGARGRVVRIKYDPADEWRVDTDSYLKTDAKIPAGRIEAVGPETIGTGGGTMNVDDPERVEQVARGVRRALSNEVGSARAGVGRTIDPKSKDAIEALSDRISTRGPEAVAAYTRPSEENLREYLDVVEAETKAIPDFPQKQPMLDSIEAARGVLDLPAAPVVKGAYNVDAGYDLEMDNAGARYSREYAKDPYVQDLKNDDSAWDDVPVTRLDVSDANELIATERAVKSKLVNKVVLDGEVLREGYAVKILRTDDGDVVIDGHTRIAMYRGLDIAEVDAQIIDDRLDQTEWYSAEPATSAYSPEILKASAKTYAAAMRSEKALSEKLRELGDAHGGKFAGWAFRVKQPESLTRKVAEKVEESRQLKPYVESTPREAADDVKDALRYTLEFPEETFTENTQAVIDGLAASGYTNIKLKNPFAKPVGEASYRDSKITATPPEGGLTFELQFHTSESLRVKDLLHPIYEVQRVLKLDESDTWQKLQDEMIELSDSYPVPPRVENLRAPKQPAE